MVEMVQGAKTVEAQGTVQAEVYYTRERVRIVKEVRLDYLVEDEETGKQYLIDKDYFGRKYIQESELVPIHDEVWQKLKEQAEQLHQLRRANSRLKNEVRGLRRAAEEERKKKPKKQHIRKGQKRGAHGRNG